MTRKLVGLLSLVLSAILSTPADTAADCRRAVVVQRNVVAVEAVAAIVAVPVPLFATGYAQLGYSAPQSYAPQPTGNFSKTDVQLLMEELRAFRLEMKALREGKAPPALAPASKLGFLSDTSGCAQCHNGPNAKGKLDLSKGLEGLTARQLALVTLRTNMAKDDPRVMPPKDSKMQTLSDERYSDLAATIMSVLEGQK